MKGQRRTNVRKCRRRLPLSLLVLVALSTSSEKTVVAAFLQDVARKIIALNKQVDQLDDSFKETIQDKYMEKTSPLAHKMMWWIEGPVKSKTTRNRYASTFHGEDNTNNIFDVSMQDQSNEAYAADPFNYNGNDNEEFMEYRPEDIMNNMNMGDDENIYNSGDENSGNNNLPWQPQQQQPQPQPQPQESMDTPFTSTPFSSWQQPSQSQQRQQPQQQQSMDMPFTSRSTSIGASAETTTGNQPNPFNTSIKTENCNRPPFSVLTRDNYDPPTMPSSSLDPAPPTTSTTTTTTTTTPGASFWSNGYNKFQASMGFGGPLKSANGEEEQATTALTDASLYNTVTDKTAVDLNVVESITEEEEEEEEEKEPTTAAATTELPLVGADNDDNNNAVAAASMGVGATASSAVNDVARDESTTTAGIAEMESTMAEDPTTEATTTATPFWANRSSNSNSFIGSNSMDGTSSTNLENNDINSSSEDDSADSVGEESTRTIASSSLTPAKLSVPSFSSPATNSNREGRKNAFDKPYAAAVSESQQVGNAMNGKEESSQGAPKFFQNVFSFGNSAGSRSSDPAPEVNVPTETVTQETSETTKVQNEALGATIPLSVSSPELIIQEQAAKIESLEAAKQKLLQYAILQGPSSNLQQQVSDYKAKQDQLLAEKKRLQDQVIDLRALLDTQQYNAIQTKLVENELIELQMEQQKQDTLLVEHEELKSKLAKLVAEQQQAKTKAFLLEKELIAAEGEQQKQQDLLGKQEVLEKQIRALKAQAEDDKSTKVKMILLENELLELKLDQPKRAKLVQENKQLQAEIKSLKTQSTELKNAKVQAVLLQNELLELQQDHKKQTAVLEKQENLREELEQLKLLTSQLQLNATVAQNERLEFQEDNKKQQAMLVDQIRLEGQVAALKAKAADLENNKRVQTVLLENKVIELQLDSKSKGRALNSTDNEIQALRAANQKQLEIVNVEKANLQKELEWLEEEVRVLKSQQTKLKASYKKEQSKHDEVLKFSIQQGVQMQNLREENHNAMKEERLKLSQLETTKQELEEQIEELKAMEAAQGAITKFQAKRIQDLQSAKQQLLEFSLLNNEKFTGKFKASFKPKQEELQILQSNSTTVSS